MAKLDIGRLCAAARRSYKIMENYRREHRMMVRAFAGGRWAGASVAGTSRRTLVNLLSQYVSIVSRSIIAKAPRVMLSVFDRQAEAVVNAMEDWINNVEFAEMELVNTLRRIETAALFSFGVAKVALATPTDSARHAWHLEGGQPFVEHVELEDFCVDMEARDFRNVNFIGNRFRVSREAAIAFYGKKAKDLAATDPSNYNPGGDERINLLGRGTYGYAHEEIEDSVELWEFYIPHHQLVVTLTADDVAGATADTGGSGTEESLHEQPWVGHPRGPFPVLGFMQVPGNILPKGPIMDLFDLNWDVNAHYRKISEDGVNFKKVLLVQAGAGQDAEELRTAQNGQIIRSDNPGSSKEVSMRGADPGLMQLAMHFKDLFDFSAGNMALLGGLAPQSKTLGQDQMLNQNAGGLVQSLQAESVEFVTDVVDRLTWYYKYHPFKVMKVKHSVQESTIVRTVTPEQRAQVDWDGLVVKVDPYSMSHQTPQQRAQALTEIVKGVILPMMQLLQQQGVAFDINAYLEKIGKYMDQPDLNKLLTIQEPPAPEGGAPGGGSGGAPTMAPETTRNYVRRSLGNDTGANREAGLLNSLSSAQKNGQAQPVGA